MNATLDDVRTCYRLFLQRNPTDDELNIYNNVIQSNIKLNDLKDIFLDSEEFNKIENNYIKVDCKNYSVYVSLKDEDFKNLILNKTWEPHILNSIENLLHKGNTFIDVGANVGYMSFNAAKKVGNSGRVLSFEPNLDNYYLLIKGTLENNIKNICSYPLALSDSNSLLTLNGTSNGYIDSNVDKINNIPSSTIQSVRGDDMLSFLDHINLIKIDVEGHDFNVIKGLINTIKLHKSTVITEFNPRCIKRYSDSNCKDFTDYLFNNFNFVYYFDENYQWIRSYDTAGLLESWSFMNDYYTKNKILLDGITHLDLVCSFNDLENILNL